MPWCTRIRSTESTGKHFFWCDDWLSSLIIGSVSCQRKKMCTEACTTQICRSFEESIASTAPPSSSFASSRNLIVSCGNLESLRTNKNCLQTCRSSRLARWLRSLLTLFFEHVDHFLGVVKQLFGVFKLSANATDSKQRPWPFPGISPEIDHAQPAAYSQWNSAERRGKVSWNVFALRSLSQRPTRSRRRCGSTVGDSCQYSKLCLLR